MVWDKYWKKESPFIRFMEFLNDRYFSRVIRMQVGKYVAKRKQIFLEAGCGSGATSSLFPKNVTSVVLDLSENALEVARKNFSRNKKPFFAIKADIFAMPFKDGTFDVVWNQGVIEHFSEPEKAVDEMLRVTKNSGNVILHVPASASVLHFIYKLSEKFNMGLWPFGKQDFYNLRELKNIISKSHGKPISVKRLLDSLRFSHLAVVKKL